MASRARGLHKSVHSADMAIFCELLIAARKKARMSQQEVADQLNKHQSFVAKYEGGERRLDVIEFLWIARVLRADPIRILRALMRRQA
jgi:transcriptional regulator with XRE-family HTH domain